ncbi:hypothetical protein PAXINDRAFT_122459, partial [Paxillus involutus ATCC 200175]
MGIQGLWPILSRAAEKRSLVEYAANEGFHPRNGPNGGLKLLTIGVDASTWMHSVCSVFRYNHAGSGPSPELRTLFYRLAAVLAMPVHAFFVFDGHGRPSVKRGKRTNGKPHWLSRGFQELLDAFGFRWCEAPGEAEAELATLTQRGLIDMALTTDNDALVFGATCVARCPDDPRRFDNVEIYTEGAVMGCIRLTHADLIFMALIGGGDYDEGIQGCGIKIAHHLSQYKLGRALWDAFTTMPDQEFAQFLYGWRNDLRHVLETDPDGLLGRKYTKLASMIPDSFPNPAMLQSYASPLTTFSVGSGNPAGSLCPYLIESQQPDLGALATFCDRHFGWKGDAIVTKMRVTVWEGATVRLMC